VATVSRLLPATVRPKKSRRVPLPPSLIEVFQRRKVEQAEQKLRVGPAWQNDDQLVFTSALGTSLTLDGFTKSVKVLTERVVGKSVSPHALRHSAATALEDANVPMRVAQEILGHASIEMTANVYTRVLDDQLADAMAALDAHVGNTG
jgi:integrase